MQVWAVDANEEQLKQCKPQPNITFQKGCAEKIDLPSSSLDLVTVATALHWCAHATLWLTLTHSACHDVLDLHSVSLCKMSKYYRMADAPRRLLQKLLRILVGSTVGPRFDVPAFYGEARRVLDLDTPRDLTMMLQIASQDICTMKMLKERVLSPLCSSRFDVPAFYKEVRRLLKPGGALAAWCYYFPQIKHHEEANAIFQGFRERITGSRITNVRSYTESRYKGLEPGPEEFGVVERDEIPFVQESTIWHLVRALCRDICSHTAANLDTMSSSGFRAHPSMSSSSKRRVLHWWADSMRSGFASL